MSLTRTTCGGVLRGDAASAGGREIPAPRENVFTPTPGEAAHRLERDLREATEGVGCQTEVGHRSVSWLGQSFQENPTVAFSVYRSRSTRRAVIPTTLRNATPTHTSQ